MIICHHTKLGYKRMSGSADIIQTKSTNMDTQTLGHGDSNIAPCNFVTGVGEGGGGRGEGGRV